MYRVLTVDDERYVRLWLKNCVNWEELGFTIIGEAANGKDALALIQDARPELVVTDMEMKGMDGIELMRRTRERYPDTEFLILSGYNTFEYVKSAVTFQAMDYLLKPVESEVMEQALTKVACRLRAKESMKKTIETALDENRRYKTEKFIFTLVDSEQYAIDSIMELMNALDICVPEDGCLALMLSLRPEEGKQYGEQYAEHVEKQGEEKSGIQGEGQAGQQEEGQSGMQDRQVMQAGRSFEGVHLGQAKEAGMPDGYRDINAMLADLGDAVTDHLQKSHLTAHWAVRDAKLYVLLYADNKGSLTNGIRRICEELQSYLQVRFHIPVMIGIGRNVPDLLCMEKSFREAGRALEVCAVQPGTGVYQYMDMPCDIQKDVIRKYDEALLSTAMAKLDGQAAAGCVEEIFSRVSALREADIETVRMVYCRLLTILIRSVYNSGISPSMLGLRLDKFFRLVNEPLTIGQMKGSLLDIMGQYIETCGRLKKLGNTTIEQARHYMDQHYREEISLRDIAEEVHMSASYLSTTFKAQAGIHVMDYITKKRMDEVVCLMKDPGLKIYEIAKTVGYQDTKYFSKVFRKTYGCAPSEYRRLIREELQTDVE